MKKTLLGLILLTGCESLNTQLDNSPTVKLQNQDYAWNHKSAHQDWIDATKEGLRLYGKEMLETVPKDIKDFCPTYKALNKEERIQFWTGFIAAQAKRESNHNPRTIFKETSPNIRGVLSTGMLQISEVSARAYNCVGATTEKLQDAKFNLQCGVKILNRWVGERDFVISGGSTGKWRGCARYWSVCRKKGSRRSINYIMKTTKELKICN